MLEEATKTADEEAKVEDEAEENDVSAQPVQYNITHFGSDIEVESLIRRLEQGDIYIPEFQRHYVWDIKQASRFVESILLGLPVPQIFLAQDKEKKRIVIDGQQRLKTLQFFKEGKFHNKRKFKLTGVQPQYEGKTYDDLDESDARTFMDYVIRAITIKEISPSREAIYHIFERLNTGGQNLRPQEIRTAIYHGFVIETLEELNKYESWREIYGKESKYLKDRELILRFLSLYCYAGKYKSPMKGFLNRSTENFIENGKENFIRKGEIFKRTVRYIFSTVGGKAFRREGVRSLNAAIFDSVMVSTAHMLKRCEDSNLPEPEKDEYGAAYRKLLSMAEYEAAIISSTADESSVRTRIKLAAEAFRNLADR